MFDDCELRRCHVRGTEAVGHAKLQRYRRVQREGGQIDPGNGRSATCVLVRAVRFEIPLVQDNRIAGSRVGIARPATIQRQRLP